MWDGWLPGLRRYIDADVQLTRAWAGYSEEFDGEREVVAPAAVETGFSVTGGSVLLTMWPGKSGRRSRESDGFRDEVVETLKELHPGVLRLMESDAGLGSTVDNLAGRPAARERVGLSRMVSRLPTILRWGFRSFWSFAARWARSRGSLRRRR